MPIHEKGYGLVLHRFWGDTLREGWTEDERLLGLYLLTNEHRTLEGFYNLRFDYAAFDLSWDRERLLRNLNGLEAKGFLAFDLENEAIFILKTLKVISPDTPLQAKGMVKRITNVRASNELRTKVSEAVKAYAPGIYECHSNALAMPLPSHLSLSSSSTTAARPESAKASASAMAYTPQFLAAWEIFPSGTGRSGKKASFAVWERLGLDAHSENVMEWIRRGAASDDWKKEDGKYVPGMQVWLKKHDFSEPPPVVIVKCQYELPEKKPKPKPCPECDHPIHAEGQCGWGGGGQCDCWSEPK